MIQRYLRVALSALAIVLATAGSINLNRAGAAQPGGVGLCGSCGCPGGTIQCCYWNGVICFMDP